MNIVTSAFVMLLLVPGPARVRAQSARTSWYELLPACPCRNPDFSGTVLGDGWAKDRGDLATYHTGAAASFRSYPPVRTPEGRSGQQCCYDQHGNLITAGTGAGTPDRKSTCAGETRSGVMRLRIVGILAHMRADVKPWKRYMSESPGGWEAYNRSWVPDNRNACPVNVVR